MVIRLINIVAAALLAIGMALCLFGLPAAIADYAREPEDAWLLLIYLATLIPLVSLCIVNARRAPTGRTLRSWQLWLNLAAVVVFLPMLVIARHDLLTVLIVAVLIAGPSAWAIGFAVRQ